MTVVTLNKKEVQKIVGKADDKKLEEAISLFGTPVEKITNQEVEVEIAPNRPDMLSQQGILRAMNSYFKHKIKEYKTKKSGYKLIVDKSLPKEWPYAVSCIVKNLSFDDEKIKEIIDIQEKLGSTILRDRKKGGIGIYPLEKISFPIKFTGRKPENIKFRPLEFSKEINGRQILSQHPTGRKYSHICQNWSEFPVFIDNKGIVMSMPPIINSHDVGKISETTKDVFVEATGTNLEILKKALTIISLALADMGGEISSIDCIQQNNKKEALPDLTPEKIKINLEEAEKLLGVELSETKVKTLLSKMGFSYNRGEVEVPAYRADILHPVDIYEDIAIAYGYDNFIPEIPEISTIGSENTTEILKRKISSILAGLGLLEISTYHLSSKKDVKRTGIRQKQEEVLESKTDFSTLRPNLLTNSLKVLSENCDARYPQKIFELGTVFEEGEEKEKLCIAISGETDFTEIKQTLDYLMRMLALEYKIEPSSHPAFIDGRTGKIIINNKERGILGELCPFVIKNWHLKMPVVALEIELGEI